MSLLSLVSTDIFTAILFEWLDEITDLVHLDAAIAHRALRAEFLTLLDDNVNALAKPQKSYMKFEVNDDTQMNHFILWKELRHFHKISQFTVMKFTADLDKSIPVHFGRNLKVLKFKLEEMEETLLNASTLLHIFAYFPVLETLEIAGCEDMKWGLVTSKIVRASRLKTLILDSSYFESNSLEGAGSRDLYVWLAKCCPELVHLELLGDIDIPTNVIIHMLQLLPRLQRFHYNLFEINSPLENIATIPPSNQLSGLKEVVLCANDPYPDTNTTNDFLQILLNIRCIPKLTLECSFYEQNNSRTYLNGWFELNGQYLTDLRYKYYIPHNFPDEALIHNPVVRNCSNLQTLSFFCHMQPKMFTNFHQAVCLNSLRELSFEYIDTLVNEDIDIICKTALPQLTSLSIVDCPLLSIQSFYKIFQSFALTSIEFSLTVDKVTKEEANIDKNTSMILFFNELFLHRNTRNLKTLSLIIYDDITMTTDLETSVLSNWQFHFPQLESLTFSVSLVPFGAAAYAIMQFRILKHCPRLNYLDLQLQKYEIIKYETRGTILRLRQWLP